MVRWHLLMVGRNVPWDSSDAFDVSSSFIHSETKDHLQMDGAFMSIPLQHTMRILESPQIGTLVIVLTRCHGKKTPPTPKWSDTTPRYNRRVPNTPNWMFLGKLDVYRP